MELEPTYLGTMLSLATVAFGFIAAGASAEVIYAVIATLIAIVVIQNLAKIAERDIQPKV